MTISELKNKMFAEMAFIEAMTHCIDNTEFDNTVYGISFDVLLNLANKFGWDDEYMTEYASPYIED